MKKWIVLILSCIFSFTAHSTNLNQGINAIIQNNSKLKIGIAAFDLTTNNLIFKANENNLFIPASNMKLFSDAAALFFLGPNFRFENKLFIKNKKIENGILKGSILLELSGDPAFSQNHLKELLAVLKDLHIKQIQGDFIIISNNANLKPYGPGWLEEDYKYDYAAPISPIILDENRITFILTPSKKLGTNAKVELTNSNAGIKIVNLVKNSKDRKCVVDFNINEQNELTLKGCIVSTQKPMQKRIAIQNPVLYSETIIKNQLKDLGIKLNGKIKLENIEPSGRLIAKNYSKPVSQLIADTLKPSDNLYAESLFLKTAALINKDKSNWDSAKNTVKDYLQKETGINLKNAIIVDGSGLSRSNLLSPLQTLNLLIFIYNKFPLAYEYISALPVAGVDGTLAQRFKNQKGLIRAKTGTMKGVLSLSGFLHTENHHTIAFAIFINAADKIDLTAQERTIPDKICELLMRYGKNNNQ